VAAEKAALGAPVPEAALAHGTLLRREGV